MYHFPQIIGEDLPHTRKRNTHSYACRNAWNGIDGAPDRTRHLNPKHDAFAGLEAAFGITKEKKE